MRVDDLMMVDGWEVDFVVSPIDLSQLDLQVMLKEFLIFCAQINFKTVVMCPRLGRVVSLDEFATTFPDDNVQKAFKLSCANVQDPLELSHNTTQNVSDKILSVLRREATHSISRMKQSSSLSFILSPSSDHRPSSSTSSNKTDLSISIAVPEQVTEDEAMERMLNLLMNVLALRPAMEEDEPRMKRSRQRIIHLDVPCRVWQGRRQRRRTLASQHPHANPLLLESLVSESLLLDGKNEPIVLGISIEGDLEHAETMTSSSTTTRLTSMTSTSSSTTTSLLSIRLNRRFGADLDMQNMGHFLNEFIPRYLSFEEEDVHGEEPMSH